MAQPLNRAEAQSLAKFITSTGLLNRQLQHICQVNGLRSTGVKADLQRRIVDAINRAVNENDALRFRDIERSISNERSSTSSSGAVHTHPNWYQSQNSTATAYTSQTASNVTNYNYTNGYYNGANGHRTHPTTQQQHTSNSIDPRMTGTTFGFKPSPFYEIKSRVGDVHTCDVMPAHRFTVGMKIRTQDHPLLAQCLTDQTMRVMVFCAGANTGVQDIAFPHQSELKINGGEVKANLRGLKNKPGSTRPVDITDLLRLKPPNYTNNVDFTFALTNKRFYLVVNVCKTTPVEKLVVNITTKKISKASVILELTKKANDAEIEETSQVLSLKCPITYARLKIPCRATSCTHVQCFDATSYLQLQEQGPQWQCPICYKSAPYERLAIDEYVKAILANTASSVEQVVIEPNGQWKVHGTEEEAKPEPEHDSFAIDDDDLYISDVSFLNNRSTLTPSTPAGLSSIGVIGPSRESSSLPRPTPGAKRSHEVIDLTADSDEDEPSRPAKRQQISHNNYLR